MFAEIILPLPLYGTFTYLIPPEYEHEIQIGSRVLVQFGRKKYYTGIITDIHSNAPDYEIKPIMSLLDSHPIVRYPQLKLWQWISEYYLCSPGEVFKCALPTGLKPESETFVTLNDDFEAPPGIKYTEKQAIIIQLLEERKKMRISDIEAETKIKNTPTLINAMLEMGIVNVDEKIVEKYRAKKETYITLNATRGDQNTLHEYFDKTKRSLYQEKALIAWLDISGWLHHESEIGDVTRSELLEKTRISPAVLRSMIDKGIFLIEKREINRFNNISGSKPTGLPTLSKAQQSAYNQILTEFNDKQTVLLHGVTGSGKTEIYSHLISKALEARTQVLFLVPEISLTTQLTDRLRRIFGDKLLVYHSKFSDNERVDIWKRLLSGDEPLVVLGARSSIFLPFAKLGLVIVDEEHESSYKQYDPAPRYNARDTAMVLASMHCCKVLLGSATPSVETYFKAENGKYGLVELPERFEGAQLPEVEIVDMREQRKKKLTNGILSSPLRQRITHALSEGKQAIVFQNRRGFAPVVICRECGWTPKCENCDVSLTYHKHSDQLKCHYCGFTRQLPDICPACGQNSIEVFGYGTERISEEVEKQWPERKVTRMDLDTTRNKDAYQEIIEEFSRQETDILVGTQMVTKGLDFEKVNIVGVINADTLLNFPDFRSNERAFNMLEQVSGRAGRRKEMGHVVIQSSRSDDPILKFVKNHDYAAYYKSEIAERQKYNYPPFTRIINIYIRNKDSQMADRAAVLYTMELRKIFGERVLGPEKPFVSRVALWYIQTIMLKVEAGASMKKVKDLLRRIYERIARTPEIKTSQIYFDVDPA